MNFDKPTMARALPRQIKRRESYMKRWPVIFIALLIAFGCYANSSRPTAYGTVPGYRAVAYGNGVDLMQSSAYRGREVDVTGYYYFHHRYLLPDSGQWSSYDPTWNDRDPNVQVSFKCQSSLLTLILRSVPPLSESRTQFCSSCGRLPRAILFDPPEFLHFALDLHANYN